MMLPDDNRVTFPKPKFLKTQPELQTFQSSVYLISVELIFSFLTDLPNSLSVEDDVVFYFFLVACSTPFISHVSLVHAVQTSKQCSKPQRLFGFLQ